MERRRTAYGLWRATHIALWFMEWFRFVRYRRIHTLELSLQLHYVLHRTHRRSLLQCGHCP
jgi:hypothetical protein